MMTMMMAAKQWIHWGRKAVAAKGAATPRLRLWSAVTLGEGEGEAEAEREDVQKELGEERRESE
jgi:hypothetical protein